MLAFKLTPPLTLSRIFLHSVSNRKGMSLKQEIAVLMSKLFIFFSLEEKTLVFGLK